MSQWTWCYYGVSKNFLSDLWRNGIVNDGRIECIDKHPDTILIEVGSIEVIWPKHANLEVGPISVEII